MTRGLSIFLIDRYPESMRSLQEMLGGIPSPRYVLTPCSCLEKARPHLQGATFDAILLHLDPSTDKGLITLARLQESATATPIVVLAGVQDENLALKALRHGAQDYLVEGQFDAPRLSSAICFAIERERLQQELFRTKDRWQTYVQDASDLIFTLDTEGRITSANRALHDAGRYAPGQLLGRHVLELIAPESYQVAAEALAHILNQEEVQSVELEALARDGSPISLEVRGRMLYENGKFVGTFHIARDISERKHAEQEREKLLGELREALAKVKTLSGLLPICASCKSIRDDTGYWTQVDVYIRDHADVEFSHGLCPECAQKLYPDYFPGDDPT
jgi:PAS domain S-box-containing protein